MTMQDCGRNASASTSVTTRKVLAVLLACAQVLAALVRASSSRLRASTRPAMPVTDVPPAPTLLGLLIGFRPPIRQHQGLPLLQESPAGCVWADPLPAALIASRRPQGPALASTGARWCVPAAA